MAERHRIHMLQYTPGTHVSRVLDTSHDMCFHNMHYQSCIDIQQVQAAQLSDNRSNGKQRQRQSQMAFSDSYKSLMWIISVTVAYATCNPTAGSAFGPDSIAWYKHIIMVQGHHHINKCVQHSRGVPCRDWLNRQPS